MPWLHIAEEVAAVAARERFRKVLVLGTRYLMEGPVYPAKLRAAGIAHEIPDAADARAHQHAHDGRARVRPIRGADARRTSPG